MGVILIAEDDAYRSEALGTALAALGHRICTCATGLDAYHTTLSEQPDLVLLGECLGVFNGFETCAMLREDPDVANDLPILIVSKQGADPRKLERAGASGELDPNTVSADLREVVTHYLGRRASAWT